MNLLLSAAFAAIIAAVGMTYNAQRQADVPPVLEMARDQVEMYRMFAYAADQYVKSTPAPSDAQVIRWDEIRAAGGLPPGMAQASMPDGWAITRTPQSWAIFAEMDAASAMRAKAVVNHATAHLSKDEQSSAMSIAMTEGDSLVATLAMEPMMEIASTEIMPSMTNTMSIIKGGIHEVRFIP